MWSKPGFCDIPHQPKRVKHEIHKWFRLRGNDKGTICDHFFKSAKEARELGWTSNPKRPSEPPKG